MATIAECKATIESLNQLSTKIQSVVSSIDTSKTYMDNVLSIISSECEINGEKLATYDKVEDVKDDADKISNYLKNIKDSTIPSHITTLNNTITQLEEEERKKEEEEARKKAEEEAEEARKKEEAAKQSSQKSNTSNVSTPKGPLSGPLGPIT